MKNSNQKPVSSIPNWFHKVFSGLLIMVLCGVVSVVVLSTLTSIREANKVETPEEKAKREESELEEWFNKYSQYSCESNVKAKLRDPDSYKRDGDFIITDNTGITKAVSWKFRARNGFNGYNVSAAVCIVKKENSGSVSTTIIDG